MGFYCKSSVNSHLYSSILFFITILLIIHSSSSYSTSFDFPKFPPNVSKIQFQNDTFWSSNNSIELTKTGDDGVGWATYSEPIQLWNATTGELADFNTHFSFIIACPEGGNCGDGLAFFLAPFGRKLPPDSSGGSLGLLDRAVAGLNLTSNKVVAVEFDTWMNDGWDPSPDHVGINVNSLKSVATVPLENRSMKDGRIANAWVTYNSATNNLSVYLTYDDNPVFNGRAILYYIVDLSKVLPEQIMVGFSAAIGGSVETHKLLSWQFNSTLEVQKIEEISEGKKNSKIGLIVGLIVGLLAVGCGFGFALFIWLKKRGGSSRKNDPETENSDLNSEFEKGTGPKRFSYRELDYATSNFDEGGKLGEGGFGGVYKGFLSDMNLNIAVKRVSRGSKQGIKEYQAEVRIISNLRHRNLVQLIGWCHERDELLLVYEFMPNRSLDNHLFRGELILTWEVRYKIAIGLASALLYLHEECEQCVVHRDIKSSNVMLDSKFNAKLGDFGLARLVDHDSGSQTTVVAGTKGYLAPECVITRRSSKESDVYSFGIVALEIACGRKPIDVSVGFLLVEWVWELYGSDRIIEAADEKLDKNFEKQQIKRLMVLGLWCAHPDPKSRPSATQVINVLKFESPLPKLPLELPAPEYPFAAAPSVSDFQSSDGLTDTLTGR
ncbi:hypothetical protein MKX01_034229 [Papaver californicum]|nr:hypothetical protein MKX01_034229 [Papaver californicum]